jgi:hypothetical protein
LLGSAWYDAYGVFWHILTPETIMVSRLNADGTAEEIRVRIWVYE